MQNSNDNEIVQYLGVKHIINYLGERGGLTQAEHVKRALKYVHGCACVRSLATWMAFVLSHCSIGRRAFSLLLVSARGVYIEESSSHLFKREG